MNKTQVRTELRLIRLPFRKNWKSLTSLPEKPGDSSEKKQLYSNMINEKDDVFNRKKNCADFTGS